MRPMHATRTSPWAGAEYVGNRPETTFSKYNTELEFTYRHTQAPT
jgi:hypothetical protein